MSTRPVAPVVLCYWEGNRRSGVALAMRHRLPCYIHLRTQRRKVGDDGDHSALGMRAFKRLNDNESYKRLRKSG